MLGTPRARKNGAQVRSLRSDRSAMPHRAPPCRSELARDERRDNSGIQLPSVIVDDHREQARSYRTARAPVHPT